MQRFSNLSNTLLRRNKACGGVWRQVNCFVCMTVSLMALGSCAAPPSNVNDGSQNAVSERFVEIALGREGTSREGTLIRWCAPLRYRVSGFLKPRRAALLAQEFRELTDLTGIATAPATAPNYFVHVPLRRVEGDLVLDRLPYLSRKARRKLGRARCFFALQVAPEGCITRADVVLPRELSDGEFEHCATEELSQSMGLPNDADHDRSIFSEDSTLLDRSALDSLLLRVLYHPGLSPGMDRNAVEEALPAVLDDLGL